ncbi:PLD nuclease N-terminal domain-containing protein [Paenibacillus sambharensis]|nr:PLD nuclease N-terminal domain-containing protein [Paenibacillus sambharensis]
MDDWTTLQELMPVLAPVLVIQLILMVTAIIVCLRSERTRGPKWVWLLAIIFGNLIGPVLFFVIGRKND